MKCNCFVKRTQHKGREKIDARSWWHTDLGPFPDADNHADLVKNGYTTCDGTVVATVSAEDEPYFGGSSATLEIAYVCLACRNTFYPHLPSDAEGLSKLFTSLLADADYDALVAERKAVEIESNLRREEALALMHERKAAKKK